MSENNYADFWNNLPGPGSWKLSDFSLVSEGIELWAGVRIVAAKRLGDAWTIEQPDDDTLMLRRRERPLTIRLRRFVNQTRHPYTIAATLLVPDEKAMDYSVGAEFFKAAFEERLDWQMGIQSRIDITRTDAYGDPLLTDCKLILNLHHDSQPDAGDLQIFACWLVWAALALEWAAETIEANPNP